MQNTDKYSPQRRAGREHVPLYPRGFIALRIVQLVLALIITGLCAFGAYAAPTPGNCLMLFVAVATVIVTTWLIVAKYGAPKAYNYWAVLALDCFLVVFWLCAFALLASEAAYVFALGAYCDYYVDCYASTRAALLIISACMSAAAGVGGLEFALFITSLSIHGVMLHRHRKAGLHCNPVSSSSHHSNSEKNTTHLTTNTAYQPVNQGQAAPPYAQPQQQQQQQQQHQPFDAGVQQHHHQTQQQMYSPQPIQQQQPQQQHNFYPQQAPTPLSAQHTGGSFTQMQPQQSTAPPMPPMPNAHEVSGNHYHSH
ncbi:integral membrane protein [Colletotrichum karsti]|uniref:Integral membrane protein n=1 Tax=Colletotrichum karsti TaxID=1095194 RepID=A0A9P6I805_9PEZI|nr:uncharacterized protein CkaCkLH20_04084 [Colletotrichum karsti]KAF9878592.1 integral membrane protein [Colletotrichum karsti]